MSNQITQIHKSNFLTNMTELESAYRVANAFLKAGCFNATVKNAEQALVILMAGNEAGLLPVESMNYFYFVKNSLNMYGGGLAKSISRAGITIKYHTLDKTQIDVSYLRDGVLIQRLTYSSNDLPKTSQAKAFAPEEKLVYHAHSRFLRYNDVGVSIPATEYDTDIIETRSEAKPQIEVAQITRLQNQIQASQTMQELNELQELLSTKEERIDFVNRAKELKTAPIDVKIPETTDDGGLLPESKPTTTA